jgi:transcriptional regulator with XRE-family HTH domain
VSIRLNHETAARVIEEQGRTVTSIAKHLGMDRANLSHCLAGRRQFPAEKIRDLASILSVPPYLLLGPEDPKAATVELARLMGVTADDLAVA